MPKLLSSAASDTLPAPMFVYDAPSEQTHLAYLELYLWFKVFLI